MLHDYCVRLANLACYGDVIKSCSQFGVTIFLCKIWNLKCYIVLYKTMKCHAWEDVHLIVKFCLTRVLFFSNDWKFWTLKLFHCNKPLSSSLYIAEIYILYGGPWKQVISANLKTLYTTFSLHFLFLFCFSSYGFSTIYSIKKWTILKTSFQDVFHSKIGKLILQWKRVFYFKKNPHG